YSDVEAAGDFGLDKVLGVSVTARTQGGSIAQAMVSGVKNGKGVAVPYTGSQLRFALALPSTHADVPTQNFQEFLLLYNPQATTVQASISSLLDVGQSLLPVQVYLHGR